MESGRNKVDWTALPSELLAIISGGLCDCMEIVRFRSVCKPWRISTPLRTKNKLSPLFPLKFPVWDKINPRFYDLVISATAHYLVRPKSDPSKAWMVSVHEPAAGSLILRDYLTYKELNARSNPDLEVDTIAATQTLVARSYAQYGRCPDCNSVSIKFKVIFVRESGELVGLCLYPETNVFAYRVDWRSGTGRAVELAGSLGPHRRVIHDFVAFKGWIFAVDKAGLVYRLDHEKLELIQVTRRPVRGGDIIGRQWVNFLVSDGELYLVWISYDHPPPCQVYKLVVVTDDTKCSEILVEQVEDLGDRVFFLTRNCCFSVSARLLPRPWKGNAVSISCTVAYMCRCNVTVDYKKPHDVFHLQDQTSTRISSSNDGHIDLFSPPASFVHHLDFIKPAL